MSSLHSFDCVRVLSPPTQIVYEVASVEDAMLFLYEWPVSRRGGDYRTAMNCCSAAIAEQVSIEEARLAFVGFARISGSLVTDSANGDEQTVNRHAKLTP